jgi:mannose-1-phosphate guanylyltransferase/phosphomannomutase
MRQLVVVAGGLGSRLTRSGIMIPKILLEVSGVTLMERYVELAIENTYSQVLLILGHQSEEVEQFLLTKKFPIDVVVTIENRRLGTSGALIQSRKFLQDEFTLILGDLLVENCNLDGTFKFFKNSKFDVLCFVKYTDHPEDSDLVTVGLDGKILDIQKYPHMNLPEIATSLAGIAHVRKDVIPTEIPNVKVDFFKETLREQIGEGLKIFCIYHQGLIRDIGTSVRLSNSESFLNSTPYYSKTKRGLLLDRDGTLIHNIPYNIDTEEVELLSHSEDFLKSSGKRFDYMAVISNQPLVARGDGTMSDVLAINQKIVELLGDKKLIQNFYICPHHPNSGFVGEVVDLKVKCRCRKPEVELLLHAGIDGEFYLTNSLYVGDSDVDIYAALRVGAFWIHIHNNLKLSLDLCAFSELHNGECVSYKEVTVRMEVWNDSVENTA